MNKIYSVKTKFEHRGVTVYLFIFDINIWRIVGNLQSESSLVRKDTDPQLGIQGMYNCLAILS